MVDTIAYLLLDTSYLKGTSFDHPDLQKLLRRSQEGTIRIFIPHIAWEERRTQLLDDAYADVENLTRAFEKVTERRGTALLMAGLNPPLLNVWSAAEMETNSRAAMEAFAAEHKIEIVPLAGDHATRAWDRYFTVAPPYNRGQPRESRRKDIPDAWILEAAIDLAAKHDGLLALCLDKKLAAAMKAVHVTIFEDAKSLLEELDETGTPAVNAELASRAAEEQVAATPDGAQLANTFAEAYRPFKDLDLKVLGYVSHFEGPTKDLLYDLMARAGMPVEIVKNTAERMALAGIIRDTGNHFLPADRALGEKAAATIESELIGLLKRGP